MADPIPAKSVISISVDIVAIITEGKEFSGLFADTVTLVQKKYYPEAYEMVVRARPEEVRIALVESIDGNNHPAIFLKLSVRRRDGTCFLGRIGDRVFPNYVDSEVPTDFYPVLWQWEKVHPKDVLIYGLSSRIDWKED